MNTKYTPFTKTKRNQAIIKYHLAHPELTQQQIADLFAISRQRVGKIIKRDGNQKPATP